MLLLLLATILFCGVFAAPVDSTWDGLLPQRPPPLVAGRPRRGLTPPPIPTAERSKFIVSGTLDQKLDHFDSSNTRTWKQRYWHNNQYYKKGAPAFLWIGGEAPESADRVEFGGLVWTDVARQFNGWIFCLEHRFYGDSHPTSDMSTKNLTYLSSYQAIEDIAQFIKAMNPLFNGVNTQWIAFGGSYPGALSAWIRLKHPELIAVSSASSAPVLAEMNFIEYAEVVQAAITSVSPSCAQSVQEGFQQVTSLLQSASGRRSLQSTFNLCSGLNSATGNDVWQFFSSVLDTYYEMTQYHGINFNLNTDVCTFHTDTSVPVLTRMKNVNDNYNKKEGIPCTYVSYEGYVNYFQDTSYGGAQSSRAWLYQTCSEFGFYQTTDSPTAGNFFSHGLPIKFYTQMCADIFGSQFTAAVIQKAVDDSNKFYGGRNLQSTRIVLPNGTFDPWHALGVLNSTTPDIVPVLIAGTAHCADMYASLPNEPPGLTQARNNIKQQLSIWINQISSTH